MATHIYSTIYQHHQSRTLIDYEQEDIEEVVRLSMQTEANEMLKLAKLVSEGYDDLGELEAFENPKLNQ